MRIARIALGFLGVASLVEVVVFVGVVLLGLLHAGRRGLLSWDLR